MEASYRLTIEDAIALDRYLVDHPPRSVDRRPGLLLFVTILGLLVCAFILLFNKDRGLTAAAVFLFGGSVIFLWIRYLFRDSIRARAVRRVYGTAPYAELLGQERRLRITPEDFTQSLESSSTCLKWSRFGDVVRTPDYGFFLLRIGGDALLVPKRAFASEAEFTTFVETAKRYHAAASSS
jgi:hypothetical protein